MLRVCVCVQTHGGARKFGFPVLDAAANGRVEGDTPRRRLWLVEEEKTKDDDRMDAELWSFGKLAKFLCVAPLFPPASCNSMRPTWDADSQRLVPTTGSRCSTSAS